ncbi:unnamed protein product, partial [Didymodactylos carnosus]
LHLYSHINDRFELMATKTGCSSTLADFHQMIKLFSNPDQEEETNPLENDLSNGNSTSTTNHDEDHPKSFISTNDLLLAGEDDDDEENDIGVNETNGKNIDNKKMTPIHRTSSPSSDSTMSSASSISNSSSLVNGTGFKLDLQTSKPIQPPKMSAAAAAARLSRLANQRIDSNKFLICSGTNSYNTIRKTKHEVRRFALYLEDTFNEHIAIDALKPDQLCSYLKHYFQNVRKADGSEYEPDTLRSFMLSIERYLKSRKYSFNILESPIFQSCREVIQEKRDSWAKPTKSVCNSKVEAFTSQHETLLRQMNIITRDTPEGLLLELLINNSKYFDQRGFESTINRSLLWGDLELKTDQINGGIDYIEYKRTIKSDDKSSSIIENIRAYANQEQPQLCPVVALRLLSYHRPQQCTNVDASFYLVPRLNSDQRVWYKTIRAGRHRLDLLLQQSMQKAGIQGKFSCMSLRKGKIKGLLLTDNNNIPVTATTSSATTPVTTSKQRRTSSTKQEIVQVPSPSFTMATATTSTSTTTMITSPHSTIAINIEPTAFLIGAVANAINSSTFQNVSQCFTTAIQTQAQNNNKRTSSSASVLTNKNDQLLDLSAAKGNTNNPDDQYYLTQNGVINLAKKIKRENDTKINQNGNDGHITSPTTNTNNSLSSHLTSMLPSQQQNDNSQQEMKCSVTLNDLALIAHTLEQQRPSQPKRKITSSDAFHALYSAAHMKSTKQSKINILRRYLEDTLGLVEFLTLYEYLRKDSQLKLQGTPIEHYEHVLPIFLTLLMLENTA